ncbi:hypothetical protein [Escherichia phage vB_EcoM-UFV05]|uniref:DNA-binding protein n=1 Tax=Escherichia phage 121/2022-2B TaxID=3103121 RepID=A0AAU6NU89_9VIRU|nr:hypothetical protein [Escherichia phage vB_EcoM-UFV09]UYE93156.1 hypothetical protein [Escherichia phage vB_EcoM-UFV05]UYL84049.1 hypothetical protein [Escherichia phage vB_EcoM-UFV06]UYL84335.1 hypothetical protein [Escherichia phage vB_EcoM-UFV10]UYL84621.1 hypothetical protein [Escherichia phage vB_EcoM-UFV11]
MTDYKEVFRLLAEMEACLIRVQEMRIKMGL